MRECTPTRSISNDELGKRVDTNDAWIRSRTGIAARRVVGADESLGELSGLAAERAWRWRAGKRTAST